MINRFVLCEMGYENSIIFENPDYDAAIVGVSDDGRVIYDYDKMVQCLMEEDGMTSLEAADFIGYNTLRSIQYAGDGAPIVMYKLW